MGGPTVDIELLTQRLGDLDDLGALDVQSATSAVQGLGAGVSLQSMRNWATTAGALRSNGNVDRARLVEFIAGNGGISFAGRLAGASVDTAAVAKALEVEAGDAGGQDLRTGTMDATHTARALQRIGTRLDVTRVTSLARELGVLTRSVFSCAIFSRFSPPFSVCSSFSFALLLCARIRFHWSECPLLFLTHTRPNSLSSHAHFVNSDNRVRWREMAGAMDKAGGMGYSGALLGAPVDKGALQKRLNAFATEAGLTPGAGLALPEADIAQVLQQLGLQIDSRTLREVAENAGVVGSLDGAIDVGRFLAALDGDMGSAVRNASSEYSGKLAAMLERVSAGRSASDNVLSADVAAALASEVHTTPGGAVGAGELRLDGEMIRQAIKTINAQAAQVRDTS